jgi:uncharacterized protein
MPRSATVVTHGEPHPANVMLVTGTLVLIDWDTVALAVPERDLWMVAPIGDDRFGRYEAVTGHMTDEEREIMRRHAAYWQPLIDAGRMVVFGPVLDGTGSWGLGVVEADDEDELRLFASSDPVVTTGTADIEVGKMLAGFVRS